MTDNVIPFPGIGCNRKRAQAANWDVEAELALAKRLASSDVAMAPLTGRSYLIGPT